jgi:hypothetical protein
MPKQRLLNVLMAVTAVFGALGLATLLPFLSHSNKSDLGYFTWCPFAPWSTLTLLVPAAVAWVVRGYVKTLRQDAVTGPE